MICLRRVLAGLVVLVSGIGMCDCDRNVKPGAVREWNRWVIVKDAETGDCYELVLQDNSGAYKLPACPTNASATAQERPPEAK